MKRQLPKACSDSLARHLRPELFKALCDPSRLALVARLAASASALTVSEASHCCGQHISGVSRHLSMLRRAGIVSAHKQGREVSYRLDFDMLIATLRKLADSLENCCPSSQCCPTNSGEDYGQA